MLDRAHLEDYIARKGPYLYHRTPSDALPHIAAQGLMPWDHDQRRDAPADWDEGSTTSYADSRMTPRSDHTYVGDGGYVRRYDGVTLRIDLRLLDPATLAADEDHFDLSRYEVPMRFAAQLAEPPREWGSWSDYVDPDCPDCDGAGGDCLACEGTGKDMLGDPRDEETLGDWADRYAAVIDSPDAVAYSLEQGSLAVKGTIPPHAVEIDPARLAGRDLAMIARGFAGVALEVAPFPIHHEGQDLLVVADELGNVVRPSAEEVPERWHLESQVHEARGARALALFNAHELAERIAPAEATPPTLTALETAPATPEQTPASPTLHVLEL